MTRPLPAEIKLLKGRTPGHDSGGRPVRPPPPIVKAAPTPPSWLTREAKAEWRRVVPELDRIGMLGRIDRASLTAYCSTWATYVRAQRQLDADELEISTTSTKRPNPAWTVVRESSAALRRWCVEFGLTPSARSSMSLPDAKDTDPDLD